MTGKVTNPSIAERAVRARHFFSRRASEPARADDAGLYEELSHLAESVEDMASLLGHLKIQVDELRRGIGHHLEGTGSVPHARRSR